MVLVKCPECNKQVSNSAETCPHCGYKLGKQRTEALSKNKIGTSLIIIFWCAFVGIIFAIIFQYPKSDYKTYEVQNIKVIELYKYPEFDFNVVKVDRMPKTQNEILSFLKELILYYPIRQYWAQQIYVYDYDVNVTSIKYAPKSYPGQLMSAAERLHPVAVISQYEEPWNGTSISICIYNPKIGRYDEYERGFDNVDRLQWVYKADGKACNMYRKY